MSFKTIISLQSKMLTFHKHPTSASRCAFSSTFYFLIASISLSLWSVLTLRLVCSAPVPLHVPPILPTRPSNPKTLPLAASDPLPRHGPLRAPHTSAQPLQPAIQHATGPKSGDCGNVDATHNTEGDDQRRRKEESGVLRKARVSLR